MSNVQVQIDARILAALLNRLGGEVKISQHEVARVDPRTRVDYYVEPGRGFGLRVDLPMEVGAIDAEFSVVK